MKPYYSEDGITIYHADCLEMLPLSADLLITDPPYGMKDKTDRSTRSGKGKNLHSGSHAPLDWGPGIHGDDQPFDPTPWLAFPKVVLFGAVHFSDRLPMSRKWLVWDKREGTTSDDCADCDFAWTNLPGPARLHRQLWRGVCRIGVENGEALQHPHQKPLELMSWVIGCCKPEANQVLLDPYAGSGTTLLAAKRFGLRAIGIEIEEKYCEIAAKRLSQKVLAFDGA